MKTKKAPKCEADLLRKVMTWLNKNAKKLNLIPFRVVASTNGTPDIVVCVSGKFVTLELKGPKARVSKCQDKIMRRIKKRGGFAYVVKSLDDAINAIRMGGE